MKIIFTSYIPASSRIFNLTALLLFILASDLFSGSRFIGIVTDQNNIPIQGVNIVLYPTSLGATTDENGYFILPRINSGVYTLKFSHVAYKAKDVEVRSFSSDMKKLKIKLISSTIEIDEVICVIDKTPNANIEYITRREIEFKNNISVEEILQNNSSVQVTKINGVTSKISIRGSNSNQVAVMMDGVMINSRMDGSFDLNSIPTEVVERIDVYKGGDIELSSQAVGGIINIITKKNYSVSKLNGNVKYSNKGFISDRDSDILNRFNNGNYSVSINYPFPFFKEKNINIFATWNHQNHKNYWSYINAAKADWYRYINHPNIPRIHHNNYYYSNNLFASINGNIIDNLRFNYIISFSDDKYGLPGWYDYPYQEALMESRGIRNKLNLKLNLNKDNEVVIDVYNDNSEKFTHIDEISPLFFTHTTDHYSNEGVKLKYRSNDPFMKINLRSGLEYSKESIESDNLSGKRLREVSSGFITLDRKFFEYTFYDKNFFVKSFCGVRGDYISTEDEIEDFYSVGLLSEIPIWEGIVLIPKVKYEQNYRLPTFSSLFWIDNMFSSGNPDLKPEYSKTKEASLSINTEIKNINMDFSFEVYEKDLENLIVWIKKSSGKYMPENLRGGKITGFEMGTDLSFFDDLINLKGSFNTLNPISYTDNVATNNNKIIYKPSESFNGSLEIKYDKNFLNYNVNYNGSMFLNTTNSIDIDPFWLHGIKYSYEFEIVEDIKLKTFINLDNLFDEQYQVVYGYPMPGRSIEMGIKMNY